MKALFVFIIFTISLLAVETGELSFYLLKDGKPMKNQHVIILKQESIKGIKQEVKYTKHAQFKTDNDGVVYSVLPTGIYQLQLVAKIDKIPQVFVRKNFLIKLNTESQLIVSLKKDNSIAFLDDEAPKLVDTQNIDMSKQKLFDGFIQLNLSSSDNKKPIKNARIFVRGMSIDVKTDKSGYVLFKAPQGERTISIIHSDFSSQTINVTILKNETITKFVELTPAAMELEEFMVLAPQIEGSVAALTAERKNSSAIADILGSEAMSKKGDSNAASALKRVSGVTLVDGKSIFIRGLGDRYSNVELNSMPLPSPDPYKRVVPLNIFPASVIGSLKVQKSYSADLSGNFAGGYIDLRTKEDISEDFIKISIGLKAHSSALNSEDGNYNQSAGTNLPSSILSNGQVVVGEKPPSFNPYSSDLTESDIAAMTDELASRSINTYQSKVPFGGKASIELGKILKIDSDNSLTVLANYAYDQEYKHIIEKFYGYSIDGSGNISSKPDTYGTNERTYSNYKQNAMLNIGYNYADIFKVKYTSLYVLDTLERTRVTNGVIGSNSDLQKLYSLDFEEKTLFANQITGTLEHELFVPMHLSFGAQWSIASLNQPNNVKYEYIDYSGTGNSYEITTQSAQNFIYHNLTTDDDVKSLYLKELAEVDIFSKKDTIELGISLTNKTRQSKSNKYYLYAQNPANITDSDSILDPDTILDTYVTNENLSYYDSTFIVRTLFSPSDYYDADLIESGVYLKTLLNPLDELEVSVGVRKSDLAQTLHEYIIDPSTGLVVIQDNTLIVDTLLPNIDLKYKFNEDNQLRLGFSQTFIYPDFREFSSSGYFHPDEAATVIGNPNLTYTDVTNFDVRFEHYFSPTEGWSSALFYKSLINPIEDVSIPSTSLPVYSYLNTNSATLIGFELEGSRNLGVISNNMVNFYTSANFTYTYSEVILSDTQATQFTSNNRQLQGLSPIVLNANLGYDNSDGRVLNLAYNYMSQRIRKVGLKNGVQEYPDQYEYPPHLLDFTWQEKIMQDMNMKFKAKNLIDGVVVWKEGDNITKEYRAGRSFEISLSYKY